jgi:dihydrofolate reductase
MASYWPTPVAVEDDPEVARKMNSMPKIVFSRTLEKADWENSRLVRDNVAVEVQNLKDQQGGDLAIFGSSDLTTSLLQMGLVDELRIIVNPVVLGQGKHLFEGIDKELHLQLLATTAFRSGNVLMRYHVLP